MLANVLWTDFPFAVKLSDSIDQEWWLSIFCSKFLLVNDMLKKLSEKSSLKSAKFSVIYFRV